MRKSQLRWRMFVLSLQRLPHDPESRVRAVRIAFLLLYYIGYALYLRRAYKEIGWQGYLFSFLLLALGLLGAVFISRSNRRADTLTLKLSAHPQLEPGDLDLSAHRQHLANELVRVAALVDRSATEYLHLLGRSSEVSPGVARQRTLLATKAPHLWDAFSAEEQSLLHSPEGAWPAEAVYRTLARAEEVRLLRWIIGLDPVLPPIALADYELVSTFALSANPALADGFRCIQPWDLRPAQDEAQNIFVQCLAEGMRRGLYKLEDPGEQENYLRSAQRFRPVVLARKPIDQIDPEELRNLGLTAHRRHTALTAVIDFLHSDSTATFSLRIAHEAEATPQKAEGDCLTA